MLLVTEDMLRMAPPPPWRIARISCFRQKKRPLRSVAISSSKALSVPSAISLSSSVPALLIAQSSRPCDSRARATSPSTSSSRATSAVEKSIRPPASSILPAVFVPASASTSQATTVAPASAKAAASTAPQPRAVPVIRTTFPLKDDTWPDSAHLRVHACRLRVRQELRVVVHELHPVECVFHHARADVAGARACDLEVVVPQFAEPDLPDGDGVASGVLAPREAAFAVGQHVAEGQVDTRARRGGQRAVRLERSDHLELREPLPQRQQAS